MKPKRLLVVLGIICLALVLVAPALLGACGGGGSGEVVTIKALSTFREGVGITNYLHDLIDRVNERSAGGFVIEFAGGPEVIPNREQSEAVMNGAIDMTATVSSFYNKFAPAGEAVGVTPFLPWEERENGIFDWWVDYHKEKMNVMYLGRGQTGTYFNFFTTKPVSQLGDLKGLRVHASGKQADLAKAYGAVPTMMGYGEVYSALERGILDGTVNTLSSSNSMKWFEQYTHAVDVPFFTGGTAWLINWDTWERIPAKYQKIMLEVAEEVERESYEDMVKEYAELEVKFKAAGIQFVKLSSIESKQLVDKSIDVAWSGLYQGMTSEEYAELRMLYTP
ncbi:TRAP transporter substrate-binding protein DctP [Chloroflexota bacterium]